MRRHRHREAHHHARLSRRQRNVTYIVFALAWTSGALWLLFHYFLLRQGQFGPEPHPLEHWWLRLHGLCAFVLLWLGGMLWTQHVRHGLAWPQRRRSGLAILVAFCVLAASGYLIYYADEGGFRDAAGVLHWLFGLALAIPVVAHALPSVKMRRRAAIETGLTPPST